MLEPIPFAGMVEIDESFDRTASHMAGEYVSNTEPVAWIGETLMGRQYINGQKEELPVGTALYTHPVKELTDEEIQELALSDEFWISEDCTIFDWHKFARAVIKLAQEK
jgi:hypothetical protein